MIMAARPTYESRTRGAVDISAAHLGASLLGLPLFDQGERVARVMEARRGEGARFSDVVVEMPRRSTKTSSIWATLIGRAMTRPGYKAVTTAQTGTTASRILLEHAEHLIANGEAVESREARSGSSKIVLYRNGGREHLDFPNRSRIWCVPPEAGAVRSAAADDILIDEAGELDVEKFAAMMSGLLPLMDTRGPLAQLIVAGTPGLVRAGPFWEMLEAGRNRTDPDLGILDYCARDNEDPADRKVWRRVHPGPSSHRPDGKPLTPMSVLEKRFKKLGPLRFAREYLCQWPTNAGVTAIDPGDWSAREVPVVQLPARFGLAADCEPNGAAAAIVAAWRDADGEPFVALLEYRAGTGWVPAVLRSMARKHGRAIAGIAVDGIGANVPVIEALTRARPMVATVQPGFRAIQGACQTFVNRLPYHQVQPDLERAIEGANWRVVEGGRLFGRKVSAADISPLVAAVEALWAFDQKPQRQRVSMATAATS